MQPALPMSWMIEGSDAMYSVPGLHENPIIIVPYNISNRDFDVKLWESDCETPLNSTFAFVKETRLVSSGGGFKNIEVDIDFNMTRLESGETGQEWIQSSETTGNYTFCVCGFLFIELGDERDVINLLTNPVTLTYDVSAPTSFGQGEGGEGNNGGEGGNGNSPVIEVTRETTKEEVTTNFDDRIIAYRCDDEKNVLSNPDPITQEDSLTVCIEVSQDDNVPLEISVINDLNVVQEGQFGQSIIRDNAAIHEELVEYDNNSCSTGICQIKFQVFARFFEKENPPDLKIVGSVSIAFSDRRHLLGSEKDYPLQLQSLPQTPRMNQEKKEGGISLNVKVIGTGDYYDDYGDYYYYSYSESSKRSVLLLPTILTLIITTIMV